MGVRINHENYCSVNQEVSAEAKWGLSCKILSSKKTVSVRLANGKTYKYLCMYPVKAGDCVIIGNDYWRDDPCASTGQFGTVVAIEEKSMKTNYAAMIDFVFTKNESKNFETLCVDFLKNDDYGKTLQFGLYKSVVFPISLFAKRFIAAAEIISNKNIVKKESLALAEATIRTLPVLDEKVEDLENHYGCWSVKVDLEQVFVNKSTVLNELPQGEIRKNGCLGGINEINIESNLKKEEVKNYIVRYSYIATLSILVRGGFNKLLEAFLSVDPPITEYFEQIIELICDVNRSETSQILRSYIESKQASKEMAPEFDDSKHLIHNNGNASDVTAPAGAPVVSEDVINASDKSKSVVLSEDSENIEPLSNKNPVAETKADTNKDTYKIPDDLKLEKINLIEDSEPVTFKIDSDGKLLSYNGTDTVVTIPNNVKIIGEKAFQYKNIESITLPDGLESIEKNAFVGCSNLKSVYIPAGCESIGDSAFSTSNPDTVIYVVKGSYAEQYCLEQYCQDNGYKFAYYGSDEDEISDKIKNQEEQKNIQESQNKNIDSSKDFTIDSDGKLLSYKGTDTVITVPSNVKIIGEHAFQLKKIESITLPDGLESIEKNAFVGCSNLKSVYIPVGCESIGDSAFSTNNPDTVIHVVKGSYAEQYCLEQYCQDNGYKFDYYDSDEDEISDKIKNQEEQKNIQESQNKNIDSSKDFTIDSDGKLIAYIGNDKVISVPNNVKIIGENAFQFKKIESITLPVGLKSIESDSFYSCEKLTEVVIPYGCETIGDSAFYKCTQLKKVVIQKGCRTICDYVFSNCENLENLTIDSCESIGDSAFYGCEKLKEILIPSECDSIGEEAFSYCKQLKKVVIQNGCLAIRNNAFSYCENLENLTIGSCQSIGDYAFSDCKKLEHIFIPENCHFIGEYALSTANSATVIHVVMGSYAEQYCKDNDLKYDYYRSNKNVTSNKIQTQKQQNTVRILSKNEKTDYSNDYIINSNGKLIVYNGNDTVITVPNNVKIIGEKAFKDKYMEHISLPDGLEIIEKEAFEDCSNLLSVKIPVGCKSIGYSAFSGCEDLENLSIGSCESIGDFAFSGCEKLTEILIPTGCKSIGESAFDLCEKLEHIFVPEKCESIGEDAFYTTNLDTVIHVVKGSYAEQYCKENNILYDYLDCESSKVSENNKTVTDSEPDNSVASEPNKPNEEKENDIVTVYVLLTNERKLGASNQSDTEFYNTYKKYFAALTSDEVCKTYKYFMKSADNNLIGSFVSRLKKKTVKERFGITTEILFNKCKKSDIDTKAEWAINNSEEWFDISELNEVRTLLQRIVDDEKSKQKTQIAENGSKDKNNVSPSSIFNLINKKETSSSTVLQNLSYKSNRRIKIGNLVISIPDDYKFFAEGTGANEGWRYIIHKDASETSDHLEGKPYSIGLAKAPSWKINIDSKKIKGAIDLFINKGYLEKGTEVQQYICSDHCFFIYQTWSDESQNRFNECIGYLFTEEKVYKFHIYGNYDSAVASDSSVNKKYQEICQTWMSKTYLAEEK